MEFLGSNGSLGSNSSWGDLLGAVGNIGSSLINYQVQKKAMKQASKQGSAMGMGYQQGFSLPAIPGFPANDFPQSPMGQLLNVGNMGGVVSGGSSTAGCAKFRTLQSMRAAPISLISDVNPSTGRTHWWRHVGQPVLFSGDVSHCKRVGKLLGKASRRVGRKGR